MNVDDKVIYVFIRQDVATKHQIVQALQAMEEQTRRRTKTHDPDEGIPYITVVGMPDKAAMDRVVKKLEENEVVHTAFLDTDFGFGVISLVTEPMDKSVSDKPNGFMCNYRLWNEANNKA